jgi:hypothetical protein
MKRAVSTTRAARAPVLRLCRPNACLSSVALSSCSTASQTLWTSPHTSTEPLRRGGQEARRTYSAHPRPTSTKDIGKRTTVLDLGEKYRKNIPLTMLTAKDFPSAVIIQQVGGIDLILVGDSLGMV